MPLEAEVKTLLGGSQQVKSFKVVGSIQNPPTNLSAAAGAGGLV
jgi:hypothetical protein